MSSTHSSKQRTGSVPVQCQIDVINSVILIVATQHLTLPINFYIKKNRKLTEQFQKDLELMSQLSFSWDIPSSQCKHTRGR